MAGSVRRVKELGHQAGVQQPTLLLTGVGLTWLFATLLFQHPSPSQKAASGVRRVMSTFCEMTQGAGDRAGQ